MPAWQLREGDLGTAGGAGKAAVATLKGKPVGAKMQTLAPRVKKAQRPSIGELDQTSRPLNFALLLKAALLPHVAPHACPQTRACTIKHCNPAQSSTYVLGVPASCPVQRQLHVLLTAAPGPDLVSCLPC